MQNLALSSQFGNSGRRGSSSSNSFNSLVLNGVLPPNEDGRVEGIFVNTGTSEQLNHENVLYPHQVARDRGIDSTTNTSNIHHSNSSNFRVLNDVLPPSEDGRVEAVWTFKPDSPLSPGFWYDNLIGNHPGYRQNDPVQDGIDWHPGKGAGGGGGTPYVPPRGNSPIRDLINAGQRISDSVIAEVLEAMRKYEEEQRKARTTSVEISEFASIIANYIYKNKSQKYTAEELKEKFEKRLSDEIAAFLASGKTLSEVPIEYGQTINGVKQYPSYLEFTLKMEKRSDAGEYTLICIISKNEEFGTQCFTIP